jgi:uncharacterized protein YbcI
MAGSPETNTRTGTFQIDGPMRSALESGIGALMKEQYGKGPLAAKALTRDEYIVVVLEGGLTRNEEQLVSTGREEEVRRFRLAFQESIADQALDVVEQVTGRRVATYHSQIVFHPTRSFEMFVLDTD